MYLEGDGADSEVTSEPPAYPETIIQLYHFSAEACHRLKSMYAPNERGECVSTYDCIAAVTWRAMTRALPFLGMDATSARTYVSDSLPAASKDGQSDGYDVYVVMEKVCSQRMMRDEKYLTYCNLCG